MYVRTACTVCSYVFLYMRIDIPPQLFDGCLRSLEQLQSEKAEETSLKEASASDAARLSAEVRGHSKGS